MKFNCSVLFGFIAFFGLTQDSTFVKVFYAGSSIKVPSERSWKITKAYITSGDGYNIQIGLSNFKSHFESEESVFFPYYIAEMELLTDKSSVSYWVTIVESREIKASIKTNKN